MSLGLARTLAQLCEACMRPTLCCLSFPICIRGRGPLSIIPSFSSHLSTPSSHA